MTTGSTISPGPSASASPTPWTQHIICTTAVSAGGTTACVFCRIRCDWQNARTTPTAANPAGWTNPRDAVCPLAFALGVVPPPVEAAAKAKKAAQQAAPAAAAAPSKPPVTVAQAASFVQAMLTSPRVTADVVTARLATCIACEHRRIPADRTPPYCDMCGCKVSSQGWQITNLASYQENLPKWGCKHP